MDLARMDLALLHEVTEEFAAYLSEVTDGDLAVPTPCAGWTVRDLHAHVLDTTAELATSLNFRVTPTKPAGLRTPRETTYRDFARSAAEAAEAVAGAPSHTEPPSDGRPSPADLVEWHLTNTLIHTWDLAQAMELDFDRPRQPAIDIALRCLRRLPAESRGAGRPFAEPPDLSPATAMDQVLALSGRDPRWKPLL